jgi:hypothetical protein
MIENENPCERQPWYVMEGGSTLLEAKTCDTSILWLIWACIIPQRIKIKIKIKREIDELIIQYFSVHFYKSSSV